MRALVERRRQLQKLINPEEVLFRSVPFLMGVPPHVQLDLLADTWSKHTSKDKHEASLIDESVIYAAGETAARIAEEDPT
jgi:hypothetical protein